ncbi:MAG: UPF0175 family protein [Candidatus Aenigmatarchaeota archaeon]
MTKLKQIGFRTSKEIEQELTELAKMEKRSKSEEARIVLEKGLKERKKELAIEKYIQGEITLEKAAEIAGVSVWEMIEVLKERKISYNLDVEAVEKNLE